MDIGARFNRRESEPPLTREDVEYLLQEVGSPNRLDLSGRNLASIDLSSLNLTGAHLHDTNLSNAVLNRAALSGADLNRANLNNAFLSYANLTSAKLRESSLINADLREADLTRAKLVDANLSRANLNRAKLERGDLLHAKLIGANLTETNLRKANLGDVDLQDAELWQADLSGAKINSNLLESLSKRGAIGLEYVSLLDKDKYVTGYLVTTTSPSLSLHITEEPLTARNFAITISALTELHTKCWLIQEKRFGDLTEYSQTSDSYFDLQAPLIINRLSHNSPTWMELISNVLSAGSMAVMVKLIDAVFQAPLRYKEKKVEVEKSQIEEIRKILELIDQFADPTLKEEAAKELLPTLYKLDSVKDLRRS